MDPQVKRAVALALAALLVPAAIAGCVSAGPVHDDLDTREPATRTADTTAARRPATAPSPPSEDLGQAEEDRPGTSQVPDAGRAPVGLLAATVVRVVDGDTATMRLSGGLTEKVRFIGVDTPESTIEHEPYGKEASRFTESKLEGRKVFLQVGIEERDRYGRLLAYVWLQRPDSLHDTELRTKLFNAQLLLQGYGQLLTIPPNDEYVESFRRYQTEARDRNRGLWGIGESSGSMAEPKQQTKEAAFVGSARSNKYHKPSCTWAKRIAPGNLVTFASEKEASRRGYVPCKVCDP